MNLEQRSMLRTIERWNSTAEYYAVKRRQSYNHPLNLSVALRMEDIYRGFIKNALSMIKEGLPVESVKDEKALRKWLKELWADDDDVQLTRLEPGMGATMGVPDCLLLLKKNWIPIELKHGELKGGFIKCDIRPAQIQWHLSVAACGGRSLFLIGTERGIYAVPGKFVEQLATKKWQEWPEFTYSILKIKHHFIALMEDERFWSAKSDEKCAKKKGLAFHVKKGDDSGSVSPAPKVSVKCQSKPKSSPHSKGAGKPKVAKPKARVCQAKRSSAPKSKSKNKRGR